MYFLKIKISILSSVLFICGDANGFGIWERHFSATSPDETTAASPEETTTTSSDETSTALSEDTTIAAPDETSSEETAAAAPAETYDRRLFGSGWIDADKDCQNTRHEVLAEESLVPAVFKTERGCVVLSGEWFDPYTGDTFTDPSLLDIDHVVPLKEAFLSGADEWPREKKVEYANYMSDKNHLIAVYRGANRSKGAKDPHHWMPPNQEYHEEYLLIWIEIKNFWELEMDELEQATIEEILQGE
ncbi:MAG: HNH endonuclease family protein [Halobacteriovoraceae bacterium]|nr:HNH endonuclease family protein [Halobacteriovoraceae bacterium]